MEKVFVLSFILLTHFFLVGQNIQEFDWLLSDTTIEKRIKYHVTPDTREYICCKNIVTIDREKYQVIDIDSFQCENGCSWRLTEFDSDWKPFRKTWYVYDTVRHFVYNYYYDSLGLLKSTIKFKSEKEDDFKFLKLATKTDFFYNSEGNRIGLLHTRFIDGDSLKWKKSSRSYRLKRDGKIKKTMFYTTEEENSEVFNLYRISRKKYSFFLRERRKYITKDLNDNSRRVSKSLYEDGQIIRLETYYDGQIQNTTDYTYIDRLKRETRHKSLSPGLELDFIVIYEYVKSGN